MQPALKDLLDKIESEAAEIELTIREVMIRFPIPPSDFIKDLGYSEAKLQFSIVVCAFNAAHYSMYLKKNPWLVSSASREAQYKAFNEAWPIGSSETFESSASFFLRKHYGDDSLAFKLAQNEVEGGIYRILRAMSEGIFRDRTDSFLGRVIAENWGSVTDDSKDMPLFVTFERRQKVVQSYKDEYAHFLPSEYLEENIAMSTVCFDRTLARHHTLMKRVKGLIH